MRSLRSSTMPVTCTSTPRGARAERSSTSGGALTSHYLSIGNAALSAPDEVTATSLDNTGSIYLTGSSADQALLDIAGSAGFGTTGILSGTVRLAGDTAIEFASGPITSLAASSHLGLVGSDAFIEDSTALGSNSALAGLASIGAGALFALHDGASVSTTGALVNDGSVVLDTNAGDGGSSLTLAGALTNSQELGIGNASLSASDEVTATSLDNTGKIQLTGSSANQALLDVAGSAGFGAAEVLSGNVRLTGDSAIEFASGEITNLSDGALLRLNGNDAFIEDSTTLGSNSALTGLASIGAGATLDLEDGASVSTTGALVNNGDLFLDVNTGDGGSSLTVGGTLTNSHYLFIGYFPPLSAPDVVTAAAIDNTGVVELMGSSASQALLDVTSSAGFGAAEVLSGEVDLDGDSAIEFASGEITSLAANSQLNLIGSNAFIEDSTALGSNSALTGLASIGAGTWFYLQNGTSVSTTGALVNDGHVLLDVLADSGGSSLTVAGALTNNSSLLIGNGVTSASDEVTAASLDNTNTGAIELAGNGATLATLNVSGATTNDGSIQIASDTETLAGAVDGAGSFSLSTADLRFNSSVSAGQSISETGANALILEQAQNFAATITGFGNGDTIDATSFHAPPATTFNFVENSAMTGGTLTLHDGSLTANILMTGVYTNSDFTLAPDSGTGTLVKFV